MPHEDYCYALERENHALNEEIESLRQQLADHIKREVMLRDALAKYRYIADPSDWSKHPADKAISATADLDGLILCEKEPVEFRWKLRSNGFVQHTEKLLHTSSKHLWDITPLYRAWEPK